MLPTRRTYHFNWRRQFPVEHQHVKMRLRSCCGRLFKVIKNRKKSTRGRRKGNRSCRAPSRRRWIGSASTAVLGTRTTEPRGRRQTPRQGSVGGFFSLSAVGDANRGRIYLRAPSTGLMTGFTTFPPSGHFWKSWTPNQLR